MLNTNASLMALVCMSAALLAACRDDAQSPPSRPEPAPGQEAPEGTALAPLDLIYVCGNKFLATNSSRAPVQVTYRVVGTDETGGLTLREASADDEGHSETELTTKKRGVVELFQDEGRVARRLNRGVPCGASPILASVASAAGVGSGSWSAPFPWPVVALHLSLLPTGKVLSWGITGKPQIWDPSTGGFTEIPEPVELFCSGHSFLSDGRLLVAGGHIDNGHGLPNISIFNPSLQSWSSSTPMRRGRWYPTNTTLANGDVVIMAGRDQAGVVVQEPEVWSSGTVRVLSTATRSLTYYPRAFLAPNGKVFYAGDGQTSRYLDPAGTGSWTTVGNRLYGVRDYGAAVMYDLGKILYVGGGRTTNTAEIIDLNSAAPAWQWTGSMANARRHLNATVLPTGEVLVTGGSSGTTFNDVTLAVHAAELWNPATGAWKTLAGNSVSRSYHATSILLPDGRVLHTGSGDGAGAPAQRNAELFSPPYLFQGPRPTMTSAPSLVGYGTSFRVGTSEAAEIAKVSLIRLGSTTHAADMNQRFQRLSFERESGSLTVEAPVNPNNAPPGHYMLFLVNGDGVPSEAKIVRLGSQSEPAPPANVPPAASFVANCEGFICNFTDGSTDDGAVTVWNWDFGDGGSATTQNPSHTYDALGSYEVTLIATDNDDATGTVTKAVTVMPPPPNTAPTAAFTQACNGFTCSFTDGSTDDDATLKSWSWDFGDGGSATAPNPSHTYAGQGSYEVTLITTDNDDAIGTVTKTVTVTPLPPNTAPTAAFTQTCDGFTCSFTDGSTDDEGPVKGWTWDFGDEGNGSSSTAPNPSHTYDAEGSYEVTLSVTDNDDATGSVSKTIAVTPPPPNTAPTAAFTSTCDGFTCSFTDGSTDDDPTLKGWSWDFGDGGSAAAQNPAHSFPGEGSYEVTLIATDNDDATGTVTRTVTVTASPNTAPAAAFTHTCEGFTCSFTDGSADDDPTLKGWSWDFGDGGSAAAQNPSHTYAADGSYEVTLIATDNNDATGTITRTVVVTAPPVPNTAPTAAFTQACDGLTCRFTDGSTDNDGTVRGWSWNFGDGGSATAQNPGHVYTSNGTYTVTLRATDDDGATNQRSTSLTVARPASIVLSVSGRVDATKQYMTLTWSGARGTTVAVHRNGTFYRNEANDGRWINSRLLPGASSYTYRVCEAGTTICSNEATVQFGSPPPAQIVLSATGRVDATKQYMTLTWSGVRGTTVDVYRNGPFFKTEVNDGRWTNTRLLPGASRYTYKVCEAGATTICSKEATVVFR